MVEMAWLTINRYCNFNCPWCYSNRVKDITDSEMSLELAKELIDFLSLIGIKQIFITGGEPTYHTNFFEIIRYIEHKNIYCTLYTNGYRFHESDFLYKLKNTKISCIGVSLKAGNERQYNKLACANTYSKMITAIENLKSLDNREVIFVVTLTKQNINNIDEIVSLATPNEVSLLPCVPSISKKGTVAADYMLDPKSLINIFISKYEKIHSILSGKLSFYQALPECLWPNDFLTKLRERNQISSGCQILEKTCIYLDIDGSMIPCNFFHEFPIGKFGENFSSKEEFECFFDSIDIKNLYNKICNYPIEKCIDCTDNIACNGGCPINWLFYDPLDILNK